jgi:hypothetical protein
MVDNSNLRDRAGLENAETTSRERVQKDIDSDEIRSRLTEDTRQNAGEEDTNGGAPSGQTSGAKKSSGQL